MAPGRRGGGLTKSLRTHARTPTRPRACARARTRRRPARAGGQGRGDGHTAPQLDAAEPQAHTRRSTPPRPACALPHGLARTRVQRRYQVTDIGNAVFDGTDCLSLSAETAKGRCAAAWCTAANGRLALQRRSATLNGATPRCRNTLRKRWTAGPAIVAAPWNARGTPRRVQRCSRLCCFATWCVPLQMCCTGVRVCLQLRGRVDLHGCARLLRHAHARTHALTHAHTDARTHARTASQALRSASGGRAPPPERPPSALSALSACVRALARCLRRGRQACAGHSHAPPSG